MFLNKDELADCSLSRQASSWTDGAVATDCSDFFEDNAPGIHLLGVVKNDKKRLFS